MDGFQNLSFFLLLLVLFNHPFVTCSAVYIYNCHFNLLLVYSGGAEREQSLAGFYFRGSVPLFVDGKRVSGAISDCSSGALGVRT